MFQNPDTLLIEILVVVGVVAFLGTLIGIFIYKRLHNIPTGDCGMCAKKGLSKKNNLIKEYHKTYNGKSNCCCGK